MTNISLSIALELLFESFSWTLSYFEIQNKSGKSWEMAAFSNKGMKKWFLSARVVSYWSVTSFLMDALTPETAILTAGVNFSMICGA